MVEVAKVATNHNYHKKATKQTLRQPNTTLRDVIAVKQSVRRIIVSATKLVCHAQIFALVMIATMLKMQSIITIATISIHNKILSWQTRKRMSREVRTITITTIIELSPLLASATITAISWQILGLLRLQLL